ncbi:hypothetical protein B0H17DRAFT_1192287 [Mycena rosella]|uniref:Uncharacterized protein n=1 Tax=Mycena rosella TaxID=1033263 RepID=A0AAD7M9E4_MYCRO|nr:hypothetical protein B0H17DRAFT_1192287 [Mycena rosella]
MTQVQDSAAPPFDLQFVFWQSRERGCVSEHSQTTNWKYRERITGVRQLPALGLSTRWGSNNEFVQFEFTRQEASSNGIGCTPAVEPAPAFNTDSRKRSFVIKYPDKILARPHRGHTHPYLAQITAANYV